MTTSATVVKRISLRPPKPSFQVRFLTVAPVGPKRWFTEPLHSELPYLRRSAGSAALPHEAEVFFDRMSIHFKKLRVVRMVDAKSKVSIYQTYSDRLIEGSPQNSGTAVPISRDQKIPLK